MMSFFLQQAQSMLRLVRNVRLLSAISHQRLRYQLPPAIPHRHITSFSYPAQLRTVGRCTLAGRGNRCQNSDRCDYQFMKPNIHYFAVFDGHNGDFVSQFVYKNLPLILERKIAEHRTSVFDNIDIYANGHLNGQLKNLVSSCFNLCQDALAKTLVMMKNIERKEMTGSTGVIGILMDETFLLIANIGDSEAILCRNSRPIELTVSHNPFNELEAARVTSAGGWIDWDTKLKPMVNGRLALTRSFGNMLLKPDIVTCEPHIQYEVLNGNTDAFLVFCSDGVTHAMSHDEIIYIVSQHESASAAAEDLATSAQQFGSEDDITVVVVPLDAWRRASVVANPGSYSMFRTMMGGRAEG